MAMLEVAQQGIIRQMLNAPKYIRSRKIGQNLKVDIIKIVIRAKVRLKPFHKDHRDRRD